MGISLTQIDDNLLITSKVDYFMRKRVVDKRKELMYAAETPTTVAK